MSHLNIEWKEPWVQLVKEKEVASFQRQLELEISPPHPLWGRSAKVIGRRVDCDDIVVLLGDGSFAHVHLVWGSGPGRFPAEYPSAQVYKSISEFLSEMNNDAELYE